MKDKEFFLAFIVVSIIIIATVSLLIKKSSDGHNDNSTEVEDSVDNNIKLLREASFFNDFYIKNGKVYVDCNITVYNKNNKEKCIKLLAHMEEDFDNGLLKDKEVYGYDKQGNDEFLLPANLKKEYRVIFIGDFAGKKEKENRNLPQIEIIQIDKEVDTKANESGKYK